MFSRFNFLGTKTGDGTALRLVEDHWNDIRAARPGGDATMPYRSDIDPRVIRVALPHCTMLERIAPGIARVRVAGARINALMGMDLRGMPFSSLVVAGARSDLQDALEEVFQGPSRAVIGVTGEVGGLSGQMLILPLEDRSGGAKRAMVCLEYADRLTRGANRLRIEGTVLRRLGTTPRTVGTSVDVIGRTRPTHAPHLRVVVS